MHTEPSAIHHAHATHLATARVDANDSVACTHAVITKEYKML